MHNDRYVCKTDVGSWTQQLESRQVYLELESDCKMQQYDEGDNRHRCDQKLGSAPSHHLMATPILCSSVCGAPSPT
jgi:hypothetical protein